MARDLDSRLERAARQALTAYDAIGMGPRGWNNRDASAFAELRSVLASFDYARRQRSARSIWTHTARGYAWAELAVALIGWAAVRALLGFTRLARALAALALALMVDGLSRVALRLARAHTRRSRRLRR